MRNSRPLLSRPAALRAASTATATPPQPIPAIRLIEPTPGTSPAPSIPPWVQISPPTLPVAPPLDLQPEVPRTRLMPKKSKLALLGVGSKDKEKEKKQQQHTRMESSGRGGFEIVVDPTYDPDIGEIIMVKKKKSRAALDGVQWGPLGEVTNAPSSAAQKPSLLRPKPEQKEKERDKWWSIGRGRKDAKEKTKEKEREKEKEKARSKSPAESRARFNSLDSVVLLASAPAPPADSVTPCDAPAPVSYTRSGTPTIGGLLAVPGGPPPPTNSSGSIALRAIRSVRSLARIGSWAQLRNTDDAGSSKKENSGDDGKKKGGVKDGNKEKESKEKKSKKQKDGEKKKDQKTRTSTSSFEAGALSGASPVGKVKAVGKKQSILGLGLPASMRLPSLRSGSTASSNRLSVESIPANGKPYAESRARSGSTLSSGSSLRPLSSVSGTSRASSGCSVRWDEDCLETVKERKKADKEARDRRSGEVSRSTEGESRPSLDKANRKESRRSSEGRRRTLISQIFPQSSAFPIVTVEEATSDGHETPVDEPIIGPSEVACQTPPRRARVRPLSDQLLGRARPVGIYEDGNGVLSLLDAATNDLAQLINRLDLQATPGTPDASPIRPSLRGDDDLTTSTNYTNYPESPLKGTLRERVSSLRLYAQTESKQTQSNTVHNLIGQQIAPWSTLNRSISPVSDAPSKVNRHTTKESVPTPLGQPHKLRLTHKRTLTPSPAADPSPVLKPLCPARARQPSGATTASSDSPTPSLRRVGRAIRAPSSLTFGSPPSPGLRGSWDSGASPLPSPVFKRPEGYAHARKRSSLVPNELKGNQIRPASASSLPIPPEAKRVLGLGGTMGSIADGYAESALDTEDPDSDIPNELQAILAGHSDDEGGPYLEDTVQFCETANVLSPPSPGCPPSEPLPTPVLALPVFRATLIDDNDIVGEVDDGEHSSEDDDTKKSFDFTGELKKLNESGGSDRRSFVEQLENAFRTPAKIDLRYAFQDAFVKVDVPPVPKMPETIPTSVAEDDLVKEETKDNFDSSNFQVDSLSMSRIVDVKEPTLLPGSDSLGADEDLPIDSFLNHDPSPRILRSVSSIGSKPSDGQLNIEFKFGGRVAQDGKPPKKPLTLSDIIPPPAHQRKLSNMSTVEEDSAVLKSILAKAIDIPTAAPRMRLDSDSSSKRRTRAIVNAHKRHSSEISFAGFKSFDEVRRGFEFANRQAFYPPVNVSSRTAHRKHESVFSIASVSSYGFVTNPGSTDPFDYGMPMLRERPSSEISNFSMSMSVDDTFAFVNRLPKLRRRVNSDASSFYFRAPAQPQPHRSHRRQDSTMSVASQGPPISLYNRSFGGHLRNDSTASSSSVAHSYAMYGANGGRAAWARHRQDASIDSIMSDFSFARLGRPGLGEKMFDKCEQSMPLTAISASPPESLSNERIQNRLSFDSIMDNDRRSSMDDSLFDKTGQRSSMSSDSVFGDDEEHLDAINEQLLLPNRFRPLSMVSIASIHSPMKEDDTMISVLAGRGRVRLRSVGAAFEASPCIRFEKKRRHQEEVNVPIFDDEHDKDTNKDSANHPRIISMPSIMSTSSSKFGGERMIKAQRGLLARDSLEDSVLVASGEDSSSMSGLMPTTFSKPCPASRSRSSTCTSLSSGAETPPLSCSEGSQSESPQSSVDLSHLNMILANVTHPVATTGHARARARARGNGHRRPISQHARASVYETIEEEKSNPPSPQRSVVMKKSNPELANDEIYIVDPDTASINLAWDDERGIVALRKYFALRDEADVAVTESKLKWQDTPFSVFAVQSFYPPNHPAGMKALLQHSLETYHPLPSDIRLRRARSRTLSRPSPYPQTRVSKSTLSPDQTHGSFSDINRSTGFNPSALQEVLVNANIVSPVPTPKAVKAQTPAAEKVIEPKRENAFGLAPHVRPRVGSTARRTALGWSKRSNGKTSTDKKENVTQGILTTPGESLRINRPRPRGRATPARPIRV